MSNLRRRLEREARDLDMKVWLESRTDEQDRDRSLDSRIDKSTKQQSKYELSIHTEL